MALADGRKNFVTESIQVPPEKHRMLIGTGGSVRRKIETDFSIELLIPRADSKGPERSTVTVTGKPDSIQKAKSHIETLLKDQSTATVQVPRHLHHFVADDGAIFRKLRNEFGVTVDHAGARPPPRPAAGVSRGRTGNSSGGGAAAMPLITDDPAQAGDTHAWELVTNEGPPAGEGKSEGTIPWALRGNEERVARAKEVVERAVERAAKPTATGYLILPDAKLYRFVIGPSGATVNSIRAKTGTQITVPRQGSGDEAIEIKGPKEGVEQAKDLILEAVKAGKDNSTRRRA
jgi:rRNA processing protein Krr1/Pno1